MYSPSKKSKFKIAVVLIMLLEGIALSGIILYLVSDRYFQSEVSENRTVLDYCDSENGKYVLQIGLNDKDTYSHIIPADEAKEIVNEICMKYVNGYTVIEAEGGWVDETGTFTEEKSLVYTFSDAEEADVISIMNEVLAALNQNSILAERLDMSYTYYSGK